jgi:hypothetical protein
LFEYVVEVKGDHVGADNLLDATGLDKTYIPPDRLKIMRQHVMAGWGDFH